MTIRHRRTGNIVVHAPGRVNLIGEHTDYCGGLALPMAVDMGITAVLRPQRDTASSLLELSSDTMDGTFSLHRDGAITTDTHPAWALYVAGVVNAGSRLRVPPGHLSLSSTLPAEAGLSSSAALCISVALALGADSTTIALAQRAQRAEAAAGVTVGLLDPIAIVGSMADHALLVDFSTLDQHAVEIPKELEIVIVHSGVVRRLADSQYAQRSAECAAAAALVGPLPTASLAAVERIKDLVLRRRARHIATECTRVRQMENALSTGDLTVAGDLLLEGHASLRDDFEVSVPAVDQLVLALSAMPGVYGARMTGGGFGGCVLAFTAPGALDLHRWPGRAWRVRPSAGARRLV